MKVSKVKKVVGHAWTVWLVLSLIFGIAVLIGAIWMGTEVVNGVHTVTVVASSTECSLTPEMNGKTVTIKGDEYKVVGVETNVYHSLGDGNITIKLEKPE